MPAHNAVVVRGGTRQAWKALAIFLIVSTVILGALRGLTAPSPYVSLSSGPVVGLTSGKSISLTTVNAARLSWGGYFMAKLSGQGANLVPYSEISSPAVVAQDTAAMAAAKLDAGVIAVYAVTGKLPDKFYGANVINTVSGMPAKKDGVLPGDLITRLDGRSPRSLADMIAMIQKMKGAPVILSILRGQEHISIKVIPVRKGRDWKIGVGLVAVTHIDKKDLPPSAATGSVEGPSAGLMLTLADISDLSTGELSAVPIAGTGTIDIDGGVGAIGGVAYKVAGAISAGAKVFFVPSGNYKAALRASGGHIEVVGVNGVGDALKWLCGHGATSSVCASKGLYSRLATLLRPPG